jgi:hypothetical protein
MMKRMNLLLYLTASLAVSQAAELPVGSISENRSFSRHTGTSLVNTDLDAYEGTILVVMLMTPWCPFCQSNAQAVGDGLLDFFDVTSRGSLRGKNDKGVPIQSILLSTEEASQWDNVNRSFSSTNGYKQWGLDASAQRKNPRTMLGYFRGGFIDSSNLYDWEDDRRRVVVLNMVKNSGSHGFREIIINQNAYSSSNNTAARAAINAIQPTLPPPVTTTFSQWQASYVFPSGKASAEHDPDGDGASNLLEFFHGTHPLQAVSNGKSTTFTSGISGRKLIYQKAKNIAGLTTVHQFTSDLSEWIDLPSEGLGISSTDMGSTEMVTVSLPANPANGGYYRIKITAP